jgi:hypothetical protein
MRIVADPMPALRAAAVAKVNERYNYLAGQNGHRDQAHFLKRILAAQIIEGGFVPSEFAEEAMLRNVTPLALAQDIVSRPNATAQRELARQTELLAIEAATHPDQLPQG